MAKSKKVNKWEAAPESIRKLKEAINGTADGLSITGGLDDANEWERDLIDILGKVLDDYNELEAKHNADCGLISKLEEDVHDLEVRVKYYKKTIDYLECEVSKYKALYEGLESTADKVTRERNHFEYTLSQLIEQLKIKNDVYVDIDECVNGNYKVENKRAADLQCDLDAAIYDLKKEEENVECLKKQITRKNAEMCNLKWERDETEKKFKILIEELKRLYDIDVTFYQRPGIDMHGLRNFGVNVDCEENRKVFNELQEALDKHKSQIDKLETKHAKATRFIARLTEALNKAGVTFHYVKFGGDGEEIFYIDSLVDRMAKKHYEEQYNRLRDIIKNYEAQIIGLKKELKSETDWANSYCDDLSELERKNTMLFEALDKAGIRPTFDKLNDKWLIQYTDKAENAFLAADQIKRDAEKKIDKLVSALDKCHMNAKWDGKNDKWCIYVRPSDTEVIGVSFDLCEVIEGYEKLKKENKLLISEKESLKSKNRSWQVSYNAVEEKAKEAVAVINGLNDYAEALKGRIQELEDRSKDIYNLATIGWINNSMYGYEEIRKMLSFDPRE